jgi:hypothetical protein
MHTKCACARVDVVVVHGVSPQKAPLNRSEYGFMNNIPQRMLGGWCISLKVSGTRLPEIWVKIVTEGKKVGMQPMDRNQRRHQNALHRVRARSA